MTTLPLMPKATAVWLVDNSSLTFEQIAEFCGMHILEIEGIANEEVSSGIIGKNPITSKQLTREEIERCEKDPKAKLTLVGDTESFIRKEKAKKKKAGYTPVARRKDKPDAIAWIVKNYPHMADAQIVKLIGTTKKTIEAIRTRSHWNRTNITPRDPVLLGICSQSDLNAAVTKAEANKEKEDSA